MKRKLITALAFLFFFVPFGLCETISGNVRKDEHINKQITIIDSSTEKPIEGAKVYMPNYNFESVTDKNGSFKLNIDMNQKAIMQVEKEGYRPFSLTIDKSVTNSPLRLGIEKITSEDKYLDSGIYHLGDDVYSANSANCLQFKVKPIGPYYSKTFKLNKPNSSKRAVLVFGSVIGLDTKLAKELGQNSVISVYSSPTEIIFNGQKIGELNINGDNQEIVIPNSLIKSTNELTIKTGKNLFQRSYTDYDDMEFANLRIEYKDTMYAKK